LHQHTSRWFGCLTEAEVFAYFIAAPINLLEPHDHQNRASSCFANPEVSHVSEDYLKWELDRDAQPLVDFIAAALSSLLRLYARTP
jgi:hypothetical protein